MKCRVCGRELDPQKSYCDKCGTPVDLSDKDTRFDGEFSWNTIDFPKPKKPKDIEMAWPDMNRGAAYVASDATEGFYTKPDAPNDWPLPQSSQRQQAARVSGQNAQPMSQTQPVQPVQSVQSPAQISRQQQDERIASAVQNMDASIFTPQNMVWTMSQPAVRPQSVQQAQATVQATQQSVQTQIQQAAPVQATQAASVQQAAPQATVQPQMQQTQSVQQQAPMYYTQPAQMQQTQPVTPVQAPVYTQPVQPVQQMQQAPQQTVQTPVQPMQQTVQQPAQQTPLYYSQPVPVQQVAQAAPQAAVQPQVQPVQQQAPMYYTQPTPVQTMQQNVQQPAQQAPLYYSQPTPVQSVQQAPQATVQPQVQPMQQTVQTQVQPIQQAAPVQQPGFFSQPLDAVAMQQTQQSGVFFAPPQMGAVNMGGVSGATIGSVGAAGIAGAAIGAGMTSVGQRAAMTGAAQQGKQPYAPINMDAWLDEQFKVSPDSDRFFTFTKQGEDFQRQLNDEYRKYTQKFDTRDLEPIRQKTEQIRQKTEQRHQEANYSEDEFSFTAPQKQAQDAARAVQHSSRQAQAEARAAQQSVERTAKESGTGFDINDEFIGFKKAEETKKPKEEFDWNFDTRTNADKALEDTERAAADAKVGAGLAGAAMGAAGMAASKAAADKEAGLPEDIEAPKAPAEQRTVVYSAAAKNAIPTKSEDFSKLSEDLFENGEPVTEFDRMIVEGTTDTSQLGDSTLAISNEQLRKEIEEVSKKVEEAYGNTPDVKEGRQKRLEAMAAARAAFFAAADAALEDLPDKKELAAKAYSQGESASTVSDAIAKNEAAEKAEKDKAAKAAAVAAASAAAATATATAASSGASANAAKTTDNTIATDAAVNRQMSERDVNALFDDKWDRELEDEGRKKGGFFGKLIRFLIVVIILFLIADFAVTKFMGDGPVKQFFHNVNEKVYEKVEPIKDKFGKKEQVETDPQKIAANEMNENIKQITFDDSKAKYQATLETNYEGLASSDVVTDPEKLAAVTKTIVGYNSSWISYVNTTTDISCLSYLKTDGSAYRSAANFSGLGKITEEYKKLNIGEIRADDDFVYVFTNEDITIKENGSSASTHSDMIYRLQLVGEEYKILDYMTIQ